MHGHGNHRDSGEAGPSGHLHPGAPAPAQQCEHPDEQDRHRDPQQVRRHQVEQVVPALPPAGRARLLGQRGGGHQQAVVAGPEHLIGQRHRSGHHCEADQAKPPPTGLQDYQRDSHEQPEERQVGADERGEAEDERDRPRAADLVGADGFESTSVTANSATFHGERDEGVDLRAGSATGYASTTVLIGLLPRGRGARHPPSGYIVPGSTGGLLFGPAPAGRRAGLPRHIRHDDQWRAGRPRAAAAPPPGTAHVPVIPSCERGFSAIVLMAPLRQHDRL
ncbi:MAG: hypothetical protein V7646_7821 [Pseudonocardia sp.]